MKLCLKCFALWNGEAEFCGNCRRSLGKKCPKGHVNPYLSPAATCIVCNEGPLDGVPFLKLSVIGPLITLGTLVFAFRYVWDHHCQVLHLVIHGVLWAIATLFDTTPDHVVQECNGIVHLWVGALILSLFLPKAIGTRVRMVLFQLPGKLAQLVRIAIRLTWRLIKPVALSKKIKAVQGKKATHDAEND